MRITAAVGCAIVGIDCAEHAVGSQPQHIFAADMLWMWWVFAAWWVFSAFNILLKGAE